MPIETFWLDEAETIICQRLQPPLAIKDFKEAFQRTQSMDSDYVVVDADAVHDLPRGLLAVQPSLTQPFKISERVVVTVGATDQLRVFAVTFFRVAGYGTIDFADTIAEAAELIRQIQTGQGS